MTAEGTALKGGVERAINKLKSLFGADNVHFIPDLAGGAFVAVLNVPLEDCFLETSTWFGFQIVHTCPFADTYPLYVRPDLKMKDGSSLTAPVAGPVAWDGLSRGLNKVVGAETALQVSRRSNHKSTDDVETPVEKLIKVVAWLNSR
jgi:hypothetical protein